MGHEHGHVDAGEFVDGVVFDAADPAHRQPGEQLAAEIGNAGEGVLQNQPADRFSQRQFAGHPAAERFAQGQEVFGSKTLFPQPLHRSLGVAIGPFFARTAFAAAEAAIVESEHVNPELQPGLVEMQPATDIAHVTVQKHNDQVPSRRAWVGREKPSVQAHPVAGQEANVFEGAA